MDSYEFSIEQTVLLLQSAVQSKYEFISGKPWQDYSPRRQKIECERTAYIRRSVSRAVVLDK